MLGRKLSLYLATMGQMLCQDQEHLDWSSRYSWPSASLPLASHTLGTTLVVLCFCHPKSFSTWKEMLWTPPSGWFNPPSQPIPSHFICSPLTPISLKPSAAEPWLWWSQCWKSQAPKSPNFTGAVIRTNSRRAECPSDGQSVFVLKCLFVHSPLALYDSVLKALIHFSVYYCVRFFSVIAVPWILKSFKRPF